MTTSKETPKSFLSGVQSDKKFDKIHNFLKVFLRFSDALPNTQFWGCMNQAIRMVAGVSPFLPKLVQHSFQRYSGNDFTGSCGKTCKTLRFLKCGNSDKL
jgi:hypothetical protein